MKKPLHSGRFFLCFACRGSLNPPNPLCKGGTGWFRGVGIIVFFFRLALDLNMVSVFVAALRHPPLQREAYQPQVTFFARLCPRVASRFPLCKGGQGGFEDPLCAIPFAKGNYQPQVYWSLHGFAPASLCASPFAKGGRGDSADPTPPNQIKTSFPPFGGNCSIIP